MRTLFARLSLAFAGILLLLGLGVLWTSHRSSEQYQLEFTQRLNAPIAMYIAENAGIDTGNTANTQWLADLAPHVMMINPSVEVYLLDRRGHIIASSPDNTSYVRQDVDLAAIDAFLHSDKVLPILGDDPKHTSRQRIFSAYPLYHSGKGGNRTISGYVYAVLAGEQHRSLLASVAGSYSLKNLLLMISGVLLLAMLSGIIVFLMLTRRLRKLSHEVARKSTRLPLADLPAAVLSASGRQLDEIDQLAFAFDSMAGKLLRQYEQLQDQDQHRREFIASISHDLRTPLTTMQSYLETMLLKDQELSDAQRRDYIRIAYRKSRHLRKLVAQLFMLARLEAGEFKPAFENFCLLELAHDTSQEFQIRADSREISFSVYPQVSQGSNFSVHADIGLIHRVFENLVGNALRHTPAGGRIRIRLSRERPDCVSIAFVDSGSGMSPQQCARAMQRYHCAAPAQDKLDGQSGLGLAIVRELLALHGSKMRIDSTPGKGTCVRFTLTAAAPAGKAQAGHSGEEDAVSAKSAAASCSSRRVPL